MSDPKTITGTVNAYINTKYSWVDPASLHTMQDADQHQRNQLAGGLTLTHLDFSDDGDYLPVGTATVTLRLIDTDEMVRGQIAALQAQKRDLLAETQRKANAIEDQISKLQALTFEG